MADKVNELIQTGTNIRLVIVDSLTAHFRAEYVGRESLATRQQKLNQHLHTLQNIANTYNVAVFVPIKYRPGLMPSLVVQPRPLEVMY